MTRNNLPPSPPNGDCRVQRSRHISHFQTLLWTKSIGFSNTNRSMGRRSSSQLPMALVSNFSSPFTLRFSYHTLTASSTSPSTLPLGAVSYNYLPTRSYQDGLEVILPRPRGSSWGIASILLCNPTFDAPGRARARARAHAASSSSKHARTYR